MKVSGFTFVKDAVKYDFPVVESIKSMLPLCDEVYVNVGVSEDNTLEIIESIKSNKIKIIVTEWDEKFKVKQRILAQQTNIPLYKCRGDWCLYLQADEVLNENDYDGIIKSMEDNMQYEEIEGLLFNYYHFFGSYNTYVRSYHWYKKEIRIIRNRVGVTSWKDAQGFRIDGNKLRVKECPAYIYHYGWVRDPYKMGSKKQYHNALHHGDKEEKNIVEERFFYEDGMDPYMIAEFSKTHPDVMKKRIEKWNYDFNLKKCKYKFTLKSVRYRITDFIYYHTGIKIGEYRNYRLK